MAKKQSAHSHRVTSVAFCQDGKSLATGSGDNTARLWEAATREQLQTLEGHSGGVTSVAFSPDGKSLVTGSGDKTARRLALWQRFISGSC